MKNFFTQVEVIVYKKIDEELFFLLLKRVPARGGFWQAITGGQEKEEALIDVVKRELREETEITEYKKLIEDVYYFEFPAGEDTGREYVFGVEVERDVEVTISHEHSKYRWVKFDEALAMLKYDTNKEAFRRLYGIVS